MYSLARLKEWVSLELMVDFDLVVMDDIGDAMKIHNLLRFIE